MLAKLYYKSFITLIIFFQYLTTKTSLSSAIQHHAMSEETSSTQAANSQPVRVTSALPVRVYTDTSFLQHSRSPHNQANEPNLIYDTSSDISAIYNSQHDDRYNIDADNHDEYDHTNYNQNGEDAIYHENLDGLSNETLLSSDNTQQTDTKMNEYKIDNSVKLRDDFVSQICQLDRGSQRIDKFNFTYLKHCDRYKLKDLLSNEILMSIEHEETRECVRILTEFIQLDDTINQFDTLFKDLLARYNCHNGYSVKWNCDDCKKAYKDWLCAMHLPFYMKAENIKPCISFCERVEQRCPYLHPITREQYGGQPVFICRDPNIPFVPEITPDIPYNEPGKCYDLCHLSDNSTELVTDSLSKYSYNNCPNSSQIAGGVRDETSSSPEQFRLPVESSQDLSDYSEIDEQFDGNLITTANQDKSSGQTGNPKTQSGHKRVHVHMKKLEELREVLANYRNQAQTHRYHADQSSSDQLRSHTNVHTS